MYKKDIWVIGDLMEIRLELNIIKKFILLICVFLLSALNAQAHNALLNVSVEQTAGDSYNITLRTENSVKIKKSSDSKDNLIIFLNSIVPSDSIDIEYDNASDIENVIVQKKNADNTVILFKGKNIEKAKIYIKELSTGQMKSFDSNYMNSYFYVGNVKYFLSAVTGIIFLFFLMLSLRPDSKKYNSKAKVQNKIKNNSVSLRSQSYPKKRFVPSINYKIKPVKSKNITIPKDFVISSVQRYEEEQERKVG